MSFATWAPSRGAFLRLASLLGAAAVVAACGGGGDSGPGETRVRAINLTTDLATIDLLANDSSVAANQGGSTISSEAALAAGTYTMAVRRPGTATSLFSGSYSLGKDQHYLAIVWGRETALRLSTLPEDADDSGISSGVSRLRVFNATIDSGPVDVYLTSPTADIAETTALAPSTGPGVIGSYKDISAGTYRLRVTGAGDPNDLRLDVPAITVNSQKHSTLVVTAAGGGVLVHGTHVEQRANPSALRNTQARVRIVASVNGNGNVSATFGSRTLVGSLRSPSVAPYSLVDAGTAAALTVRVNGSTASSASRSFAAGSDNTVLVYGNATAGGTSLSVLADDNRLPSATGRSRLRLVNGTSGTDPLTLSVDYGSLASDIVAGAGSGYFTVTSTAVGAKTRLDVTSPAAASALFIDDAANLQNQSTYTVFMLGGNAGPTGVIRKER